jgi:signal transduction histidine kinase
MQVFTSIIVLGSFLVVYIITDVRSYKIRKANSMLSLAQVIGTNSVSTLEFQDNEAANQVLSGLRNIQPEIVYAAIFDKNGDLFASYHATDDSFTIPEALNKKETVFAGHYLFIRGDINNQNNYLGKVVFRVELSELEQIKQTEFNIAGILLFVALAFSFLIALAIQTYVSKRLLTLVRSMKEVGKTGNYDKTIQDDGKDEISILISVFNNLLQQVKENQQRKDEFISIISHELKTPLTSVKGYLELLNAMEEQQPNQQFVKKGLDNVKKLETLIRDLLDVSKIQSGQLQLNMKEFILDDLLEETIDAIQMVSTTHQIIWENHLNDEVIIADRHRIEQVLTNLLSNAIKYSPGEKRVFVYSKKSDSEIIIKVKDFGIGVPKEEQTNIFERFYRSKDMSVTILGFGLGLYICKDIISRHSGKIWVETEERGSSFYFTLPLRKTTGAIAVKSARAKTID